MKIVQHSQLFYWWPVWLIGFVLGMISLFSDTRLAVVPSKSRVIRTSEGYEIKVLDPRAGKEGAESPDWKYAAEAKENESPFRLHISSNKSLGVIWAITLILVIFITNVPLRGMWSVVVLVSIVLLSIIFFLAGIWEALIAAIDILDIRVNTGGYFFISTVLFIMWAVTVFLFDQQTYWVFTPGQLRIHEAIGGGETAYDTRGMMTEKHRDDLFRHWILGLGTGDLTVRTAGAQPKEFRIQNVWWVGHKLAMIQKMQSEIQVVGERK
ncbi:MAG TPA: hypothetical protein VKD72_21060 [Gemmataceae bacterium]|nr:hypothetical protein [Gemmataceae bacterium]